MRSMKPEISHRRLSPIWDTMASLTSVVADTTRTISQEMMEADMDDHLGYGRSERSASDDYRNGYKSKRVNSSYGSMEIEVPQDRKSISIRR